MQQQGLLQTHDLYKYILETNVYPREPKPLKEIRALTATRPKAGMATAPDAGQMITILLKLVGAKKTIEIGVFTGYSLLLTALAIPDDGKIVAIDVDRESYEIGHPVIERAGVEHKIEFIESEALHALDKMLQNCDNEGSFDFAFVDANKDDYIKYHEQMMKLVKVNGVVIYDNTLWKGTVAQPESVAHELLKEITRMSPTKLDIFKEARVRLIEFNTFLAADPRIEICMVPLGDGLTICRRLY